MKAAAGYSDEELIALLNQGDKKAFEIIYNRYAPDLYRYARNLIITKEDCEEILQVVFEHLWTTHKALQVTALRAYLYKSVRYKIIDYYRQNTVRRKYNEHFLLFEIFYDSIADPEGEQETDNLQRAIEDEIKKMPGRVQMAINLRLTENLSNTEIAARMNVSNKTIENYMHLVYSQFRESYRPSTKANP